MQYKPSNGSSLSKEKAQAVGEYLEKLGSFTPNDVVEAARPEASPLHEHFEWNDLAAAEKYRLTQARHLVNTITVIVKSNGRDVETRAFHSITIQTENDSIEQRYTSIKLVSQSQDMREQVIQKALMELEGWKTRYEQYKEVFGENIFKEVELTVRRAKGRPKSVPQPTV